MQYDMQLLNMHLKLELLYSCMLNMFHLLARRLVEYVGPYNFIVQCWATYFVILKTNRTTTMDNVPNSESSCSLF